MALILDQSNTSVDNDAELRKATDRVRWAQQFTPSISATLKQVILQMKKVGTPTGNITVTIFSDNGSNLPNAQIGTASNNVDVSTLSTSYAEVTFSGLSAILTSGTKYWIVLSGDFTISTSNFAMWNVNFSGDPYSGGIFAVDGGSWSGLSSRDGYFKEYYDDTTIVRGGAFLFFT